ncbi:tRNA (guanine(6)-N(2))-methyltransferase THUMP3 isoform X2 [Dendrobates tinctorius]|uniref:tRNA (guanine(6)-N(2))-methyltransferase THUMP3 isoform X2 n=1 Tax=Dendrobates tinctorius TaxID=92724 RepID=UPI003CC9DC5C
MILGCSLCSDPSCNKCNYISAIWCSHPYRTPIVQSSATWRPTSSCTASYSPSPGADRRVIEVSCPPPSAHAGSSAESVSGFVVCAAIMSEVEVMAEILTEATLDDPVASDATSSEISLVTVGATVPTGFEFTAAAEVEEKLGCPCRISRDRGKVYFDIGLEELAQVHRLRSVDNLFVVVQEFIDFPFKEAKEAALQDFQELAAKLSWEKALKTWELNNNLKKKKKRKKTGGCSKERKATAASGAEEQSAVASDTEGSAGGDAAEEQSAVASDTEGSAGGDAAEEQSAVASDTEGSAGGDAAEEQPAVASGTEGSTGGDATKEQPAGDSAAEEQSAPPAGQEECKTLESQAEDGAEISTPFSNDSHENTTTDDVESNDCSPDVSNILKFRVTCNRAGDKHSFTSNEAARDFGGAVQEHFLWKADMTNFDVEVLLNISYNEMLVGIALTEESLHRRNITHFGPTTLRSTLAYGMLRLCDLEPSDVVIDPMCGTGAIPIEGVSEWPRCFFIAGDNSTNAVNRTSSNIGSLLRRQQSADSTPQGLPIDPIHWDISRLPLRSGSVDVIITDMPFGKRIGSKKKNWDLYPACLREMSRVCRAGTGRAVLLTHDRKCFIKALAKAGHLWRKMHTVWVNIGGLHAGVYLLKRTLLEFSDSSSQRLEENKLLSPSSPAKEE